MKNHFTWMLCYPTSCWLPILFLATTTPWAAEAEPTVVTRPATTLGQTAMTVNGAIHPHGLPTTYYFEYGPTTQYGRRTADQSLPPRLAAFYHESWNDGQHGWESRLTSLHYS